MTRCDGAVRALTAVLVCGGCTPLKDDSQTGFDSGSDAGTFSTPYGDAGGNTTPDAADAQGVDGSLDAAAPCAPLDNLATDIYVDVNATGRELGTAACPYHSITEGIAAAARSTTIQKTVHVAAGLYNAKGGETFPLSLRNGTSLVGENAATTTIQGFGIVKSDGEFWNDLEATIAVGDRENMIAVQGLKILPEGDAADYESAGVFCDTGNVRFPQAIEPAPNTELADLEIGPGFSSDVKLVGASYGCNMKVIRSKLHGGTPKAWGAGVFATGAGCGGYGPQGTPPNPISLVLGDDTPTNGNTFDGVLGDPGKAIASVGCATTFTFKNNIVQDSDIGLWVESLPSANEPTPNITVVGNIFRRINGRLAADRANQPILAGAAFFETPGASIDFNDNAFSEVRAPLGSAPVAALLIAAIAPDIAFPASFRARGNQFVGNDIGVLFRSANGNVLTSSNVVDFGTNGTGNNAFRCNAHSAAQPGADVVLDTGSDGMATVSLSGNRWDHAIPSVVSSSTSPDGTDVALVRGVNPKVDTSDASLSSLQCPNGFAP